MGCGNTKAVEEGKSPAQGNPNSKAIEIIVDVCSS
jgi:hypothetical protein